MKPQPGLAGALSAPWKIAGQARISLAMPTNTLSTKLSARWKHPTRTTTTPRGWAGTYVDADGDDDMRLTLAALLDNDDYGSDVFGFGSALDGDGTDAHGGPSVAPPVPPLAALSVGPPAVRPRASAVVGTRTSATRPRTSVTAPPLLPPPTAERATAFFAARSAACDSSRGPRRDGPAPSATATSTISTTTASTALPDRWPLWTLEPRH